MCVCVCAPACLHKHSSKACVVERMAAACVSPTPVDRTVKVVLRDVVFSRNVTNLKSNQQYSKQTQPSSSTPSSPSASSYSSSIPSKISSTRSPSTTSSSYHSCDDGIFPSIADRIKALSFRIEELQMRVLIASQRLEGCDLVTTSMLFAASTAAARISSSAEWAGKS